ncbi:MAG: putative glycoside hydrolase [bacterium]
MSEKIRHSVTCVLIFITVISVSCDRGLHTRDIEKTQSFNEDQREDVFHNQQVECPTDKDPVIGERGAGKDSVNVFPDVESEPLVARMESGAIVERLEIPKEPLRFEKPAAVKGIYVNAWAAGSKTKSEQLIDLASRTEINTFVVDIKDASGYVSHPTRVEAAHQMGADQQIRITDLLGLLDRLHTNGIYPIARIVVVKDPLLTKKKPELAIQDTAGGVWIDEKGASWANLFEGLVWDYHLSLAKEMIAIGFPEIQWDYIRFPDSPKEHLERASFPNSLGRTRSEAVSGFLDHVRKQTQSEQVAMTADVFGATTSLNYDLGIGQLWEEVVRRVDVVLPMVYPSHYWSGSFNIEEPNQYPYEVVKAALGDGLERSSKVVNAGSIRPWLQDFSLGAPPYGGPEIRAQIQATYDAGINEWILWNAASRYTEEGLVPQEGFPEGFEPMMRFNGSVVPVSSRLMDKDSLAAVMQEDTLARPQ